MIYENQAAKMLLNKEAALISKLAHDGMITPYDSELELKRINRDLSNIETLRKAHSKYIRLYSSFLLLVIFFSILSTNLFSFYFIENLLQNIEEEDQVL